MVMIPSATPASVQLQQGENDHYVDVLEISMGILKYYSEPRGYVNLWLNL